MGVLMTSGTGLQIPDVRRLEQMPSLPAWVESRLAWLKVDTKRDQKSGKFREVLTLPASLILTAGRHEEVRRHVAELDALCRQCPEFDARAEAEMLMVLLKMTVVLPSMTQNEFSAEARGEAYMESLADVPTWAVRSAIRRWNKGI